MSRSYAIFAANVSSGIFFTFAASAATLPSLPNVTAPQAPVYTAPAKPVIAAPPKVMTAADFFALTRKK